MSASHSLRPTRPRLCLATSYTANYSDIGSFCALALHLYAAKWGSAVHVDTDVTLERHPAWHRVKLIPALFDRGYEYVLWTDADSLFLRFDEDILAQTRPGKDLYLVEHTHPDFPTSKVPNSGVMLVRNSTWAREFFQRIWSLAQYATHVWWENAALIHLFGYRNLLRQGPYAPDAEILSHVHFLDEIWNHHPVISQGGSPIIRHYAGFSDADRRLKMPVDAVTSCHAALETDTNR